MPELPDLQVFSHNLKKTFVGKTLKEISVLNKKKLNVPVAKLKDGLENQKLTTINRVGKELYFEFKNGNVKFVRSQRVLFFAFQLYFLNSSKLSHICF